MTHRLNARQTGAGAAVIEYWMPHGMCIFWDKLLLAQLVISNVLIAVSYFAIPAFLFWLRRQREMDIPLVAGRVLTAFSAFIISCGLTHVMDVVVLWTPMYRLQLVIGWVCAALSMVTAVGVWMLRVPLQRMPAPAIMWKAIAAQMVTIEELKARRAKREVRD